MATGYDNRETTRRSFAFNAGQARQTNVQANARPSIGRSGLAGNAATGGGNVIMSENPQSGQGAGANIPEFLNTVLEPHIKAQQERRMYEGYAAAAGGEALAEIAARQTGLSAIFGPTDFQRGAQFFATQRGVSEWKQEQVDSMDDLARLPPQDLGRWLSDSTDRHLTGDVFADNAIRAAIVEETSTLIPLITQRRVEFEQTALRTGAVDLAVAGGGAYAAMVEALYAQPPLVEGQEDPLAGTRIGPEAVEAERDILRSKWLPIEGMTPTAYSGFVEDTANAYLAGGNLRAFNVMLEGGNQSILYQTLGADKYNAIVSRGNTATEAALQDEAMRFIPELAELEANQIAGTLAPGQFYKRAAEINTLIGAAVGTEEPYFDANEILTGEGGVVRAIVARNDETRRRAQAQADAAASAAAAAAAAAELEATNQREANQLFIVGDIPAALAAGATQENINRAAYAAYQRNDIPALVKAARTSGTMGIFTAVQQSLQAPLSGAAAGISEDFSRSYSTWQAIYNEGTSGPSVAASYFGQYHAGMLQYHNLVRGGRPPEQAHQQVFVVGAGRGRQPAVRVSTEIREAASRDADTALGRNQLGSLMGISPRANAGSRRVVQGAIEQEAERIRANSDGALSPQEATRQAREVMISSGRLEVFGGYAWTNVPGSGRDVPLANYMPGATPDVIGRHLDTVLERRLKDKGLSTRNTNVLRLGFDMPWAPALNENIDISITRLPDANGTARLLVSGTDLASGRAISELITSGDLMAEQSAGADLSRRQRLWDAQYSPTAPGISVQESQRRINMNPIGTGRGTERPERPTR